MNTSGLAFPKGDSRKRTKARAKRQERSVITAVREFVAQRDGACRILTGGPVLPTRYFGTVGGAAFYEPPLGYCSGNAEWAHLGDRKRFKTRNMAPSYRHDSRYSAMLCTKHHGDYDTGQLHIDAMTLAGADGPLRFERDGQVYQELPR